MLNSAKLGTPLIFFVYFPIRQLRPLAGFVFRGCNVTYFIMPSVQADGMTALRRNHKSRQEGSFYNYNAVVGSEFEKKGYI
jgi:hypothetical protein